MEVMNKDHNRYMKTYRNSKHASVMGRRYREVTGYGVSSIQASKMRFWSDERIEEWLIKNGYKTESE